MDLQIRGKTALVTGASKGIGKAIALDLAREGVRVLVCARSPNALDEVIAESKAAGHEYQMSGFVCDLSDRSSRETLISQIRESGHVVSILVHNVGGPSPTSVMDTDMAAWAQGFDQLFQSVVHLNQAFVPDMQAAKWGRILCVTSISVLEPIAGLAISNSIRSATTAMLKTLSDELAPYGITVNCVAPGTIATDRLNNLMQARMQKSGQTQAEYEAEYLKAIPMGRLGTPQEFSAVAVFLASGPASYVTGSTITLDGGKRRSTY